MNYLDRFNKYLLYQIARKSIQWRRGEFFFRRTDGKKWKRK